MRRVVSYLLVFCFLGLFADGSAAYDDKAVPERRVVFDEDMRWATSRAATDEIIDRIANAGFNVYVPCVWHGRGAHFVTRLAHVEPQLAARMASGDDPLAYLLKKAHAKRIEVHPWVTVMLRLDNRYPEFFSKETPAEAYDVHNAEFRRFIVDLIVDMARRYPLDGINLDYIRSTGTCECPSCSAVYAQRYHRSLHDDAKQAAQSPFPSLPTIEEWHGEAVGAIVREVAERARAAKPGIVISVDGYPLARHLMLQGHDCAAWQRKGWIDVIFGMEYRPEIDVRQADLARRALSDPTCFTILESTYDLVARDMVRPDDRWRVNGYVGKRAVLTRLPQTLVEYVQLSRDRWPGSGMAFYHYKQLTDAHVRELRATVFRELVAPAWPKTVRRKALT